jgi:hypothetical protein
MIREQMKEVLESGAEELRRAMSFINTTTESAWDGFTAEECIRIVRACWASPFDIYADNITVSERRYARRGLIANLHDSRRHHDHAEADKGSA